MRVGWHSTSARCRAARTRLAAVGCDRLRHDPERMTRTESPAYAQWIGLRSAQSASRSVSLTVQSCNNRSGFPDGARLPQPRAWTTACGFMSAAPVSSGESSHPAGRGAPQSWRRLPAPASITGHAVMQSRAFRPQLPAIREPRRLPYARRRRRVLTGFLDHHRLERRRCPREAAVWECKTPMPPQGGDMNREVKTFRRLTRGSHPVSW
jgi:hypothetical protein